MKTCNKVKIVADDKILETESEVMVILKDGRTIRKKYDILDKLKFSTLKKKLFFKSKSLLGKRISKKLWYDSFFDNSLPSNWLEKNLQWVNH